MRKRPGRIRRLLSAAAVLLVFSGCSIPHADTAAGNFAFRQGDYQRSLVYYLSARETGRAGNWSRYNLGTAYYALGEWEAAEEEWRAVSAVPGDGVEFESVFNTGIIAYHQADYKKAYEYFKRALKLRPDDTDARINCELSYKKMDMQERAGRETGEPDAQPVQRGKQDPEGRLLEYINLVEWKQWIAPQEQPSESFAEDW